MTTPRGVIVVGAGAAGLTTAIFTRRLAPGLDVLLVDGSARPGAKILVSGGSRCNVTNAVVTEKDYWGGKRTVIRRVLSRLPVPATVAWFEEMGVRLKEEPNGKLFPATDRSRDVLDALLSAARATGVEISPSTRVQGVRREGDGFRIETPRGPLLARAVVLATGGLSLPKTGSDGAGLGYATQLGHSIVPTTPALAPLVLGPESFHGAVSGVTQPVELSLFAAAKLETRIRGSLLWTHVGISGPAALDMSRHWLRVRLEGRPAELTANLSGESFEQADARLTAASRAKPRATVAGTVTENLPHSVAASLLDAAGVAAATRLADLTRDDRRRLARVLTALPLPVTGSRGYSYAEATAGGVALDEIDPSTMESRLCRGLFLVGEMLDVDGRLGGFNFQWAWASGRTAGEGIARRLAAI